MIQLNGTAHAPDDNTSEYGDPRLYDAENPFVEEVWQFLLGMAQQSGSTILDVGCGTGRYALPLAQAGFAVTGVDLSAEMLTMARSRSADLPVNWVQADATRLDLDQQFDLIIAVAGVFMHMLTQADQIAFLQMAHRHLKPDGILVFDCWNPRPAALVDEAEQTWFQYTSSDGREVDVSGTQTYDYMSQIKTETAIRRWQNSTGRMQEHVVPLRLRYTYPQELALLLTHCGFKQIALYGNYQREPATAASPILLPVYQRV